MDMDYALFLSGLIFAIWFGWAGGNFATSFIYRLPRNERCLGGENPFCDVCRTPLATRDKFPIFSWIVNKGRCRFCGTYITAVHTVVEVLYVLLFALAYVQVGYSETMTLICTVGGILVILCMIEYHHRYLEDRILHALLVAAVAMHLFSGGKLMEAIVGAAYGGVGGLVIAHLFRKLRRDEQLSGHFITFCVCAGIALPPMHLGVALIGGTLIAVATRRVTVNDLPLPSTMGIAALWTVLMLFPKLAPIPAP